MAEFFKKLFGFFGDVAREERIPRRDKMIVAALLVLIVSPFDFINDFVPVVGMLDDVILMGLVSDYFFKVLDEDVVLRHYPFGMKSFARFRGFFRVIALLAPAPIRKRLWKYKGSPYR